MLERKMLRDIWEYKVQFISIFLMAFIGMLVFTGIFTDVNCFETTVDNYYDDTNFADGWIYSDYLVDEFLHKVYALGATNQMERQLVVDSQAILNNKPYIKLHFVENNTISKFYLLEGKELDIDDSEGVWLDKRFADARNLKVGDEISFESNGMKITKVIRGVGYSPEYVYYMPGSEVHDYNSTGFAYLSHKAFPSDNIPYNILNVKFAGTPETYSQLLSNRLGGYYTTFLQRSSQYSVAVVEDSISQQTSLSYIFPAMFIVISMLMLLTTMERIISNQRIQIGILKANGFNNNQINLHYILPGFLLVILGSILGIIVGPFVFHMLVNPSRMFYFKLPYWNFVGLTEYLLLIPFVGALALLVSYYSIKDIVKEPASIIIKPKVPKTSNLSFVEKLKIWQNLSFNFRWNFRNINRNKFRAIMTIFGIMGCSVLLLSGFALYEQIDESEDWYFNDVNHFESKLKIDDDASLSQINSIAQNVNGTPIMETYVELFSDETVWASLLVMDENDLITITDEHHDKMDIPDDGVSISKKLADNLNIGVGDTVNCSIIGKGKNVNIKIDNIHSSPISQGLVMSPHKLEQLGLNYTPTHIVTSQHIDKSIDGIKENIYLNDLITEWEQMEKPLMIVINALVFFAILLSLVILYNLNMLSFTEMKNEITTLKVLGFKSTYLTKLLATQSIIFIIIGFLIGIPISYYVLWKLMSAFGKNIYLIPSISVANLAVTFIIIISISLIMDLYFSRKIKKFDMVETLKDLER